MGKITIYVDDDELNERGISMDDITSRVEELEGSDVEKNGETIKANCADPDRVGQNILNEFGTCIRMTEPW